MQNLLKHVSTLIEEVEKNEEGFNPSLLMEAISITEFTEPVDGDTLLDQLRAEGLL